MTTDMRIRAAQRNGDLEELVRMLRRAGFVLNEDGCPHCNAKDTGWGVWSDSLPNSEWCRLRDMKIGLPYVCLPIAWEGCGGLFVSAM